ncbi:MAG: hypothetical protein FXF47_07205 [Candidatus Mcinerneyibacterium aminivorans]|uniref:Uncharacterized protein n=1 Tax=Candidatus Mcinerneyibacterium aminivorans TaxID=2703815 RepID=A0A5D0MAT9_9BACT|nr:MAG: hypothetical protein FXF47_07205 [Candidatus Mcinerneyibacterium aminivorans]
MKFKVGLQGYRDMYHRAIFDEDAPGITASTKIDKFNLNTGLFVLNDDEVNENASQTFGTIDIKRKSENNTVKGSLMYYTIQDELSIFYLGAGTDITLNNNIFGGHFIYNMGEDKLTDQDINGFFGYAYAGRKIMDNLKLKLKFGYTPSKYDADSKTMFYSIKPNAVGYGLEYFYRGSVYDYNALTRNYQGILGEGNMVGVLNASYKFLYANLGMIYATNEDIDDKHIGNEIDLGITTEVAEKIKFKAVYAMFMPCKDSWSENETASELSMQLNYKF